MFSDVSMMDATVQGTGVLSVITLMTPFTVAVNTAEAESKRPVSSVRPPTHG
jgi:hypothetical protein